jgi:hypothetical protein
MPEMNKWGDQPTLEMVRLVVEYSGFPFLDKDKRVRAHTPFFLKLLLLHLFELISLLS